MAKTKKATASKASKKKTVTVDRRSTKGDRRTEDRRKQAVEVADDRRSEERRKSPRRRQIDPTTCERDYTNDEIQFMHAMDEYKRRSGRMFPTCSEILEVMRDLGYRKLTPEQLETYCGETIEISADALNSESNGDKEEEDI